MTLLLIIMALAFPDPCTLQSVVCDYEKTTIIEATVYGYNSEVGQCDDSPFITASGYDLHNGGNIVANNCQPFGILVRIGERTYVVEDRMNSRYGCEVFDIWFEHKTDALNWGKRTLNIEVIN